MNNTIVLKGVIDEDFVNYKLPSMTLMFPKCSFKCNKECGDTVCQNSNLEDEKDVIIPIDYLCERYLNNPITEAIVCQGLEPLDSFLDLDNFIDVLRNKYKCDDPIVIYSGYNAYEIGEEVDLLSDYKNIIIKYGRYIPDRGPRFDDILGVELASDNQFAEEIRLMNV